MLSLHMLSLHMLSLHMLSLHMLSLHMLSLHIVSPPSNVLAVVVPSLCDILVQASVYSLLFLPRLAAELHAAELHAAELHAAELHAAELHAAELHAAELHAAELHAAAQSLLSAGGWLLCHIHYFCKYGVVNMIGGFIHDLLTLSVNRFLQRECKV
ncbi:hypothetical protein EYF80_057009 [Liparis tanakae]|uniref:Uncharacterized protein n=1 Tax=Liparis tanakae TaxID=230148 RepID=A0A4Z2EVJ5_9TELE|nr:hypothetical protein EYF80_057009 [Liparis tanakae]